MHDAYTAVPILAKLPLQIESIATYDENLLVGTKQGHLLMYSITPISGDQKFDVQLERSNKYFSKKPITQIAALPEFQILISLSDNIVNVHDMTVFSFPLLFALSKTKGATLFVLDNQKTVSLTGEVAYTLRMCVVVRKKLQLYYWKNKKFHDLTGELRVPDVPKVVAWSGDALCVGFKGDYCLIKLTGDSEDLFPTVKEPYVIQLQDDRLAVNRDKKTLLLDFSGKPTNKYSINWSETPLSLEHDPPYLIAILSKWVEIRTIEPRMHIQNIELNNPRIIAPCSSRGQLFIASNTNIWCLVAVPVSQQIKPLLQEKQFELALDLLVHMKDTESDKKRLKQDIQNLYAFHLFCEKQFRESMNIFFELGTDASHVIGLFPELLPQDFRNQLEYPDKLPILEGIDLENGLIALIEYLTQVRHGLMGNASQNTDHSAAIVEGSAVITKKSQLLQIIDTALLKCYLKTNDALVASLLRLQDNHCHLKETEMALKNNHKYSELIILYQSKGLHEKALELLHSEAHKDESRIKDHERTIQYLQHLGKDHLPLILKFAEWVLKEHPEDGLRIFTEDLNEVESLPREEVYSYLLKVDSSHAIPYLEHVLFYWEDKSAFLHNALVLQYREKILKLRGERNKPGPDDGPEPIADCENGELGEFRRKLVFFLETSFNFVPEMLLVNFPHDCLFQERAILLGKLGHHEQALAIYCHVLKNHTQATDYCNKNYDPNKEGNQDVYLMLLKMYVCPPDNVLLDSTAPWLGKSVANLAMALELLKEHPNKIDPVKAMEMLPANVPIQNMKSFIDYILQQKVVEKRTYQVLKSLLYAEHLQVHEQRIHHQSQNITITEVNICVACKKRIANSAFAHYPSGDIVHYSCQEKYLSSLSR